MAEWPSMLPTPDWDTGDEFYKPQIRQEFEANYVQSRPTATRGRGRWDLKWGRMLESEYQALKTFFNTYQGCSFTWTHPVAGTTHTCVFSANSIKSKWGGPGQWKDVECPIEEL